MKNFFPFFILLIVLYSCQNDSEPITIVGNPHMKGFDLENSDPKAIAIADKVMEAMGGRQAYEETRLIKWDFFGSRKLAWDKLTGDVRIEFLKEDLDIVVNIHNEQGKVKQDGKLLEATNPKTDSLLQRGKSVWINDSYWLVMPFKLKDSGVTLGYVEEDTTEAGQLADVLSLTFKEVGDTPNNKYLVYVDKSSNLVSQWDFYTNATDPEPRFKTPWADYQNYGKVKLSGDRGRNSLKDIEVLDEIPEGLFSLTEAD